MWSLALFVSIVGVVNAQGNVPCGEPLIQPIASRIVGGQVARPGSSPWMAMLVDDQYFISGSGVIINPNVILTSAQHFERPNFRVFELNLHDWKVYAGEYNISKDDPNEKLYHIRRVVFHPGYNVTSLENDIAIVITVEAIQWNDNVRPACIAHDTQLFVTQLCYLAGWGSTESTGNEEVLNQLMYPILDSSVCARHWDDFLPNTEICAGYENQAKDFCSDDIGSPLMCKDPFSGKFFVQGKLTANSGKFLVQGIASSGGDCTKGDEPGIFEDVSKYADWIKKAMQGAGYPYMY